jgi:hypothetical protein
MTPIVVVPVRKTPRRKSRGKQKIIHTDLGHAISCDYGRSEKFPATPNDPMERPRKFLMEEYQKHIAGIPEDFGGFYRFRLKLKYRHRGHWSATYGTVQQSDGLFHYTASTDPNGRYPWVTTVLARTGQPLETVIFDAEEMMVFAGLWCLWFQLCQVGAGKVRGNQMDAYKFANERLFVFRESRRTGWVVSADRQ